MWSRAPASSPNALSVPHDGSRFDAKALSPVHHAPHPLVPRNGTIRVYLWTTASSKDGCMEKSVPVACAYCWGPRLDCRICDSGPRAERWRAWCPPPLLLKDPGLTKSRSAAPLNRNSGRALNHSLGQNRRDQVGLGGYWDDGIVVDVEEEIVGVLR